jgi:hypothetical protein
VRQVGLGQPPPIYAQMLFPDEWIASAPGSGDDAFDQVAPPPLGAARIG